MKGDVTNMPDSATPAWHSTITTWLLVAGYIAVTLPVLWSGPRTWAVTGAVILPSLILGTTLVALSVMDLATLRLPDALTLPLIAAGLLCAIVFKWDGSAWDDVRWRVLAAGLGYGFLFGVAWIYQRVRHRPGVGLGDAKLLAAAGAWLGLEGLAPALMVASLTGLGAALLGHFAGRSITAETRMPFGPFLAGATWLLWLYGPIA
jgi:leader peptidase (prepilin peptidase) / N-methyltransferase